MGQHHAAVVILMVRHPKRVEEISHEKALDNSCVAIAGDGAKFFVFASEGERRITERM
jgi:hypothetical protein